MKAKIHIPTMEYGFIEVELDFEDSLIDVQKVIESHDMLKIAIQDKEGWNTLEWAKIRDTYAKFNKITPEEVEGCNKWQRLFINQMKLVHKSIKENE